ncbi:putative ubiquitin-conjugating enzyme E2 25 [Bidens hawaiensis]|uniref:putative ubiquitin-conjugating enzyme E2 25 n=1 Tax=Bidens hawaiensis TaxID=980011 RepID=UPI004049DE58
MEYEWNVLKDRLPDTIFVRAYESRKDLLRAVIIGAPYHDGLFFFDMYFPPNYPFEEPLVRYHSAGLGINPHLFECGEVRMCLVGSMQFRYLSLWPPVEETVYDFLVSLRDTVLSAPPFFNQPGFLDSVPTAAAEYLSLLYNENILPKSLSTMIETIRNPPKNFEDFVAGHFRNRMADIIMACKAYREGLQVGGNKGSCSSIKFREVVTLPMLDLGYIYLTHGAREAYHAIKALPLAKIAPSNDVANIIKKDAVIPPCDVACRRGKKDDGHTPL